MINKSSQPTVAIRCPRFARRDKGVVCVQLHVSDCGHGVPAIIFFAGLGKRGPRTDVEPDHRHRYSCHLYIGVGRGGFP